jgi:hypothetical protein
MRVGGRFRSGHTRRERRSPWCDQSATHPSRKAREGWGTHCVVCHRKAGPPVIFQDVVPFRRLTKPVAAGAVRKCESAVTICKARTYRVAFCTAQYQTQDMWVRLRWVQRLDHLQPPASTKILDTGMARALMCDRQGEFLRISFFVLRGNVGQLSG